MSSAEKDKSTSENNNSAKIGLHSTIDGKVVSMVGNTLVMAGKDGIQYSHTLASNAKLTCDDTICTPADLKAGGMIRVTTKKYDRNVVTCIESLDKHTEFAQCS